MLCLCVLSFWPIFVAPSWQQTHLRLVLLLSYVCPFAYCSLIFSQFFTSPAPQCLHLHLGNLSRPKGDSSLVQQFSVRVHLIIITAIHSYRVFPHSQLGPVGASTHREGLLLGGVCNGHRVHLVGCSSAIRSTLDLFSKTHKHIENRCWRHSKQAHTGKHHCNHCKVFTCLSGLLRRHLILFAATFTMLPTIVKAFSLFPFFHLLVSS